MISSILSLSHTSRENSASLAEGAYYCRVQATNMLTMHANSSQRFVAMNMDEHFQIGTSCSDSNFIATDMTCALHGDAEGPIDLSTTHPDATQEFSTSELLSSDGPQPTDPPSSSSPGRSGGGSGGTTLQVWIYVLVAVAAVFAMIIIILAILCVGLCLRRSQSTMDSANCKFPTTLVHNIITLHYKAVFDTINVKIYNQMCIRIVIHSVPML